MTITLAHITTGDAVKPPRLVIYGGDGVGKTTFAAHAPSPVFIRAEDGLGVLQVPAFPPASTFGEVLDAMRALASEEHTYRTLVVDSLDWLERLIWTHTAKDKGVQHIEDMGYGKGYVHADDHWGRFFLGCDVLRERKGMQIILICHAEIKRFDAPDTEPYDRYQLKLHKRASARAAEWADVLGFAQHETVIRETDVGFNKKVIRGYGTGERVLHVTESPAFDAKNRYALPSPLPLHYAAFRDAMRAALTPSTADTAAPTPTIPTATAEEAA